MRLCSHGMVFRLMPSLPSAFSSASSRWSDNLGGGSSLWWFCFGLNTPGGFGTFWSFWWLSQCSFHVGRIYSDNPASIIPPEPPRASADCVSYIEQSARTFGFSSAVARQLARCRHSFARVNYQAKWVVYRAWCARHGHSVSRPTVPKVASFLLYLSRSLSLSYSSIASYRSMLSVAFRFVLPELFSPLCAS